LKQKKRVVAFDIQQHKAKKSESIEGLRGTLPYEKIEKKLMHSILQNDKKAIEQGKILNDALNQGLNSLTPDLLFQQVVKNCSVAKRIYGPSLIKLISGYNPDYIEKNINIPEFQRELKERIQKSIERLKEDRLIDKDNSISERGIELASLVTYFEELDNLVPKGILGEKTHKKESIYGSKEDFRNFKKSDRYRDIAIKKSVKVALRRSHKKLSEMDLRVFERQSKGQTFIIYALDASGSMKGSKIAACKRAGIALAYRALEKKDKVGLIVFGSELKEVVEPTTDFAFLLKSIAKIKASRQTDIVRMLRKAVEMFPRGNVTKHLILISDALPTIGKEPERETLEGISSARDKGITVSVIGIDLDEKGKRLAKKIAELGQGRLYVVRDVENVDKIVLEDYYSII
jgi:Mg-chelatase subunit ChlD